MFPSAIAAAFIDPGRKADLVVTNITQGTVSVLLGNGDGTFGAPITSPIVSFSDPACAHRPFTFALGDFNGDNEVDLAVLDQGSTNACTLNPPMITPIAPAVYLLRGIGNGSFAPATASYQVGNYPSSIVAGDFNGDGKLDWAAAGSYSNLLYFMLGDGNGNFPHGSTRTAGTLPTGLAVGEFNNDKITDLAVANFFDNNVSILKGADVAISIAAGGGNNQSALVNTTYGAPLKALVKDALGNPVSGVPVTFTAPLSTPAVPKPTLVFSTGGITATVLTNASGIATSPSFKANLVGGGFSVTASITPDDSSAPISTSFNLSNHY